MSKKLKYRSKLEKECHDLLGDSWEYEPFQYPYVVHRNYTPDFVKGNKCIEVKGFFRTGDTQKYKAIANKMKEEGLQLVFLMPNPDKRTRKGGKITYRQWCIKNEIKIFSLNDIKALKKC
jgi:hypothetical protein